MRINKSLGRRYSFEERTAYQSRTGKLTGDKLAAAVARLDQYAAKLAASPHPNTQRKYEALMAVPEIASLRRLS